jgi:16S rRNA (adenine1518-N6/adenine1519-N6)-dimethyltransferase
MDPNLGRPKRSLSQNFLVDVNIQKKIVAALRADATEVVVEVGPGRGALTQHLVDTVSKLVLIELDHDLAAMWSEKYRDRDDVTVLQGDVLTIPYNITSPIIFRLLERPRPKSILLTVQKEVAQRITAPVGSKEYGALSVGVRSIASAEILFGIGRHAFKPKPGVDSALIRIVPVRPEPLSLEEELSLRRLVRSAFQWRRKQLKKILRDHEALNISPKLIEEVAERAEIDLTDRPERLSPEAFLRLAGTLP